MAFRRSRRQLSTPYDLAAIAAAYRHPVEDALRTKGQFEQLVASIVGGPLQDRLREIGGRVEAGVCVVWETACKATSIERLIATLNHRRIAGELKHARRSGADQEVIDALTARLTSVERLQHALEKLRSRLPVLEARLATVVARAAELTLTSSAGGRTQLEAELETLVVELQALGEATAELP